jgi:hypothetical protein
MLMAGYSWDRKNNRLLAIAAPAARFGSGELSGEIPEICPAARTLFVVETKQEKITEKQIP